MSEEIAKEDLPDFFRNLVVKTAKKIFSKKITYYDSDDDGDFWGDLPEGLREELEHYEQSAIHIHLWKQLPDHAIQILEQAGYTKYDKNTDSIVFVQK